MSKDRLDHRMHKAAIPEGTVVFSDGEKVFTAEAAAEVLGVHKGTVLRYIKTKLLSARRVGKRFYIAESALKEMLTGK